MRSLLEAHGVEVLGEARNGLFYNLPAQAIIGTLSPLGLTG
jgi:hypothetical protein